MDKLFAITRWLHDFWVGMRATDWLPWVYLTGIVSFVLAIALGSGWLYLTVAALLYAIVVHERD